MITGAIHNVRHSGSEEDVHKKSDTGQFWFHLLKILCTHFCFNLVFAPLYHMRLWYYNYQQKQHLQEAIISASDM